jgi:hypothetical protein
VLPLKNVIEFVDEKVDIKADASQFILFLLKQ